MNLSYVVSEKIKIIIIIIMYVVMRGIYQLSDSDSKTDTDSLTLTLKIAVDLKRLIILRFLLMNAFIACIYIRKLFFKNFYKKMKKLSNFLTLFLILDKFYVRFQKSFILQLQNLLFILFYQLILQLNQYSIFYFYIQFIKII